MLLYQRHCSSQFFFLLATSPMLGTTSMAKHASFFFTPHSTVHSRLIRQQSSATPDQDKKQQQPPYTLRHRTAGHQWAPIVGSHYFNSNPKMSIFSSYLNDHRRDGGASPDAGIQDVLRFRTPTGDVVQPFIPQPAPYVAHPNIMQIIKQGCQRIITRYGSGNTEAFYQRMLLLYLYENGIPSVAEIDCFVLNSDRTPVLVGRIDIEVQHNTILELKVAPQINEKHVQQLRKYVNARVETGMQVVNAAVICFTDKEQVDIRIIQCNSNGNKESGFLEM